MVARGILAKLWRLLSAKELQIFGYSYNHHSPKYWGMQLVKSLTTSRLSFN